MSGKFMKIKKILIPTLTLVIIASQLCACSCSRQDETLDMINRGEQIEIEVAVPDFEEQGTETKITWTELAKLTTYSEFRTAFENALGITVNDTIKSGIVYVDAEGNQTNNSTLYNAFMNKAFLDKWNTESIQSQLNDGISTTYADLEDSDYTAAIINAYFNLLDDNQPNYFNGGASLSRAEAMTILMRAVTPVEALKANDTFKSLVGESEYTSYASYMDSNCFINSSDKSISEQNFNGAMTRAEFVYMVMNQIFGKEAVSKFDSSKVSLNDCKNAGDIATTEKFSGKDYCNSYVLTQMIKNPEAGATTSIYKALAIAKDYGVISAETRWDEAITKTEGIEIIISAFEAYVNLNGSKVETNSGELNTAEYTKEAEASYEANKADLDCTKEEFVNTYVSTRLDGKTSEEALANCLANFIKTPDVTVEDDSNHKEPETYLDENGVPHIKQEETTKGNGTYTYGQDIKNIDDAIAYFESLGYTFKDKANYNISVEEVNAIYKDFSHIMTSKELEGFLNLGPNLALVTLARYSLPSDPNAETETKKEPSGYFVEDSYKKPDSQDEKETTSSTEEETTEPSIDNPNGRPADCLDDLDPSLNDIIH